MNINDINFETYLKNFPDANGNFGWGDYSWTKWGDTMFPLSHGFGGIPGGIDLVVTDPVRVADVFVRNKAKLRDIDTTVEIVNSSASPASVSVEAAIVENWAANKPVKNPKTVFTKAVGKVLCTRFIPNIPSGLWVRGPGGIPVV